MMTVGKNNSFNAEIFQMKEAYVKIETIAFSQLFKFNVPWNQNYIRDV